MRVRRQYVDIYDPVYVEHRKRKNELLKNQPYNTTTTIIQYTTKHADQGIEQYPISYLHRTTIHQIQIENCVHLYTEH